MKQSPHYSVAGGGALWSSVKFDRDRTQDYADVLLRPGIVLQLVRGFEHEAPAWEVWAISIDGVLYREPRDFNGERLQSGDFSHTLDGAFRVWLSEREAS